MLAGASPISLTPNDTLGAAVAAAAAARVHRVWVVDAVSRAPLCVVGLTDMLRVLTEE